MPYFSRHAGRLFFGGALLVLLFIFFACSQPKPTGQDPQDTNASLSPDETGLPQAIFPHPDNWDKPTSHGIFVIQSGFKDCWTCHSKTILPSNKTPACASCHSLYPHIDDWNTKALHGAQVLENGLKNCATSCHGTNLLGGDSKISCHQCHEFYPHLATWEKDHGLYAKQKGLKLCQGCHGEDFKKQIGGKNCFSCHPYPHQKSWKDPAEHGDYTLAHSKADCQPCHGEPLNGGSSEKSCFASVCHLSYPHLEGWKRDQGQPQGHGDYVNTHTFASCATQRCHGIGLAPTEGITKGNHCGFCHEGTYPHLAGWNHGAKAKIGIDQCKKCHGVGLDVAPGGFQTCKGCHATYLKHLSAQVDAGANLWNTFGGHGQFVLAPPYNGDKTECQTCHGADYLGGISGKSCKTDTCHPSYPHEAGWYPPEGDETSGDHGPGAYGDLKNSCATAHCHGEAYEGNPAHGIKGCFFCHPEFPHTDPQWKTNPVLVSAAECVHALTFIDKVKTGNTADCTKCHGNNYEKVMGGDSCISCHPNNTVTHQMNWLQKVGDPFVLENPEVHGQYYSSHYNSKSTGANCKDCHNPPVAFIDLYNAANSNCSACHGAMFNTAPGEPSTGGTRCNDCHNLPGINTPQTVLSLQNQSECYGCHLFYPHTAYQFGNKTSQWLPAANGYIGHIYFLYRFPLFNNPPQPLATACGGTSPNLCHFNGYRSTPKWFCTDYCHQ